MSAVVLPWSWKTEDLPCVGVELGALDPVPKEHVGHRRASAWDEEDVVGGQTRLVCQDVGDRGGPAEAQAVERLNKRLGLVEALLG